MIAEKHMSKHALETANQVLQGVPIDPTLARYCSGQGLTPMEDASTWADDIRRLRPEEAQWHYIDIPRGAGRGSVAESCPSSTGCVTSAIRQQIELLRSTSTDPKARAEALRFVVHMVGDLHQPLHCTTNNDLGANCLPVQFFDVEPTVSNPEYETYRPNLHAAWDVGIIQHLKGTTSTGQWAATLDRQFASRWSVWQKEGINLDEWAWENHQKAETAAYGRLSAAVPVEKPVPVTGCSADNHVAQRLLKLHEQVLQPYVDAVAPVVDEQIAKAGVRLAMILNQLWP